MRPVSVLPASASAPSSSSSTSASTAAGASSFSTYRTTSPSVNSRAKVKKVALSRRERQQTVETLNKLKELVPTVPMGQTLSKVELLQHVIDYIFDLQSELRQSESADAPPFLCDRDGDAVVGHDDGAVNVSQLMLHCGLNSGDTSRPAAAAEQWT